MPIQVICPGCHARFSVSEKFAGQRGPCPKCKVSIKIPGADEKITVHEPEHEAGARSTEGKLVLKPIERQETKVQPLVIVAAVGTSLVVFAVALILRLSGGEKSAVILGLGALLLGPPLAAVGYVFLRSEEDLEPYGGLNLWIRASICGGVYALLWGVFPWIYGHLYGPDPVALPWLLPLGLALWAVGAGAAYCCFDLDYGSGIFHYGMYLLVTVLLRLLIGLPAVGPAGTGTGTQAIRPGPWPWMAASIEISLAQAPVSSAEQVAGSGTCYRPRRSTRIGSHRR